MQDIQDKPYERQKLSPLDTTDELDALSQAEASLRKIEFLENLIETIDDTPRIPEHPEVRLVTGAKSVTKHACPVCHETEARPLYAIEGVTEQLVVCHGCGLGSLNPMPGPERIGEFYPAEYYGSPTAKFEPLVEYGVRLGARLRVRTLLSGLEHGSRVLDVGCGRGVMLRAMLDLGHEAHGVEITAEAAAGADPRAQIRIAPDLADAEYETNSFDAVIMWHVLEHLPNPSQTLEELRRIIRPGGRLILAVPNFASWQAQRMGADWFHLDLPRHLYHFTPQTLTRLLNRYEFDCRGVKHFALLQNPFGWLQSSLNRLTDAPRNSLYSLLHRGDTADSNDLSARQRRVLRAAYLLGLPLAGAVSVAEAMIRRGGTIAVTAQLGTPPLSAPIPSGFRQGFQLAGATV